MLSLLAFADLFKKMFPSKKFKIAENNDGAKKKTFVIKKHVVFGLWVNYCNQSYLKPEPRVFRQHELSIAQKELAKLNG